MKQILSCLKGSFHGIDFYLNIFQVVKSPAKKSPQKKKPEISSEDEDEDEDEDEEKEDKDEEEKEESSSKTTKEPEPKKAESAAKPSALTSDDPLATAEAEGSDSEGFQSPATPSEDEDE